MATLFVGNLASVTTDADLRELFTPHGEVASVSLPVDRNSGRHRGFALVEMTSGAEAAMRAVNGKAVGGRRLAVSPAQPRPTRPSVLVQLPS
jgi:RNA recognition motif-containing protein